MRLHEVVDTRDRVASTRSRLEKVDRLAALLRRVPAGLLETVVAHLSGELRQGRIGIGPATARQALEETGPASASSLTIQEVDDTFGRIAAASGPGSGTEKTELLGGLLARATETERRFLAGLVLGELRQGAQEGVMVEAIATAADVPAAGVRRAMMLSGELPPVASAVMERGRAGLEEFSLQLFRPVQPMLASTAEDVEAALESLGEAVLDAKLDGARVQAHREGDEVRVYTRRLRDVTVALPEVVEAVRALPGSRLILDGEVLALHPDGRPRPFQVTMRRFGRRRDVESKRQSIPLTPFWFDLLLLDGDALLDDPLARRARALDEIVPSGSVIGRAVTGDADTAADFLDDVLRRGHEGIMAKAADSAYEAGSRGGAWLKVKPAHTLDLVVLAAEWGSGRRRGWLSNLHLGARDPESGGFVMLGKTFKGLTDEMLQWQTEALRERQLGRDGNVVHVRPELVVEIAFDGVQESPTYPGGLALRFARVKRYRTDKAAQDADTIEAVREIFAGSRRG